MKRKKRKAEDKDGAKDIFYKRSIRVELAVTSLFYNKMQFERMEVNWTNDCFCTKFVHDESGNASSSGGDIAANLTFAPNSTLKFAFDVHLKQSNLHRKAPRSTSGPASPPSPSESGGPPFFPLTLHKTQTLRVWWPSKWKHGG